MERKRNDWEKAVSAILGSSAAAYSPPSEPNAIRHILIVDDDPAIRQMLSRLLAEEGYQTRTASNGSEAIAMIDASTDLVLLDLQMPGKDGWETFEWLTCKYPWLPAILITARTNQYFPAIATGVDALLEKPLDLGRLLDTIRALLAETLEERTARLKNHPSAFGYSPPKSDESDENKQ